MMQEWTLTAGATLGSSVRAKGILLEIRARLPPALRKALEVRGSVLILRTPDQTNDEFTTASRIVSEALVGIESLPVIPREIEDILTISATERHRWLKDGRLRSVGTRTVKLRGRAKSITFHVFDPRDVEDVLNRDLVATWREDDVATAAEKRRRAAWKAKLTRSRKSGSETVSEGENEPRPQLRGWGEFDRDGPLR
jgi:hypothetical protein